MGVEFVLREAFTQAQRYREAWEHMSAIVERTAAPSRRSTASAWRVIGRILSGDLMIHAHSYRADEILMLLDVVRDFGIETSFSSMSTRASR
jgi:hypothetical protein